MPTLTPEQRRALHNRPAGPPPPGKVSTFIDPANSLPAGWTVLVVCWSLASIFFVVSLYTKAFVLRRIRVSDYAMIAGWGLYTGYFVPVWLFINANPGLDQWNLQLKDQITSLYYFRITHILYSISIFLIKLSILFRLIQIFSPCRDSF
ncbi:hypothetical protein BDV12DRAFT_195173 [Aspergillus spectabilis]